MLSEVTWVVEEEEAKIMLMCLTVSALCSSPMQMPDSLVQVHAQSDL